MSQDIIGTRKGDYEILAVLGAGGMGQVYKVRNTLSDRIEAMKVLLPNLSDQQILAERFLREIKVLASLSHPNIAALSTALTIDNQLVMIMEYVEGTTIASRLQQGPIPLIQALNYTQQVLAALSYAHKQHIVHRDIKPANMMIGPNGVVKLMDFGIARNTDDTGHGLTMTNATLGSVAYMSPEQVKGQTVDGRSDLYSLGVSLYEMITGQRPFKADTGFSIMQAHLQEIPRPPIELRPDLPPAVSQLIIMAMAKDPAERFQTADAFQAALASAAPNLEATIAAGSFTAATQPVYATPVPQTRPATPAPTAQPTPPPRTAPVPAVAAPVPQLPTQPVYQQPAAQPQYAAQAQVPPAVAAQQTHRGRYIALGAAIVVIALVAAGIYVPRRSKTDAASGSGQGQAGLQVKPDGSVAVSDGKGNGVSVGADGSANVSTAPQTPAADAAPAPPKPSAAQIAAAAAAKEHEAALARAAAEAAAEKQRELEAIEHELDQMVSRTEAVNTGLDSFKNQQSAGGYGLRGDMTAAASRLQTNMSKAQGAFQTQDPKAARKYMDLAEPDLEKLEKFLHL
jgi:eukaryotic-like serine/threonine-protein kinase